MKILRIRLINLNSLKGEHLVDLTAEPLASAGLFAITGPTGAGKSTLLDAITLALFGKAARYGSDPNPEHVMSRHCGQCSAEVEFEVSSGVYRAVWERRRAREKPDGTLQVPKRYIYDAAGQPLAQQIREAESIIENLVGLNYERFLRSALLAQGEFARFLKANANERAELLENLTGTEIYSRLGQRAHIETNRRETELQPKEAGLQQISILTEEARNDLDKQIQSDQHELNTRDYRLEETGRLLEKINALQKARDNQKRAADDLGKITEERKEAGAVLERLRLHRLTVPFVGDLARLDAAEAALNLAKTNRENAETKHTKKKSALARANAMLRASTEAAITARIREAKEADEAIAVSKETADVAHLWLEQHKNDAGLANQVGDLAAVIGDLKNARGAFDDTWSDWKDAAFGILPEEADSFLDDAKTGQEPELTTGLDAFLDKARGKREALKKAGADAKIQFDLRKDHLDKAKLVAKLEDHRHNLKGGEPCPLCGALEHPYAEGAVPGARIADLEEELKKAEEKLEEARNAYRELNQTLKSLETERDELLGAQRKRSELSVELANKLQPLSVELPIAGKEDALRIDLQKRDRDYREQGEKLKKAKHEIKEADRIAKAAVAATQELNNKLSKLPALPEDAAAEVVAPGSIQSVSDAEELYSEAVNQENATSKLAADRKEDDTKAAKALAELKEPLEAAAASSEFKTLENLKDVKLPADEVGQIEALDKSLGERKTAADALLKLAGQEIEKLLEEKVPEGEEAKSFKSHHDANKIKRDNLLAGQAERRNQLQTDTKNRKLREETDTQLEQERKELAVWRRLHELIGSHDGSKFRRYAQGISLDILSRHANRHLEKLSDRYRICRDEQEALNLQIEDLHQAGVKRPMVSLSGGESFLVSLALALGLADLAGRTVRIDSLFIDEGFGTLDPETLEVAIAALESLRHNHKTVGIISHVALLKERINTQILVEKQAGGISRISVIS